MVLGDLAELAVPEPERAGIADMSQRGAVARDEQGGQRGPHVPPRRVLGGPAAHLPVRLGYCLAQDLEQRIRRHFGVMSAQRLEHGGAGHFPGGVAAQAVGDREQPAARVGRILVVLPDQAGLGHGGGRPREQHRHLSA